MKAGVIGGSGYTGAELLRLLAGHPDIEVTVVTAHAHAGQVVGEHSPSLAAAYPGLVYESADTALLDGLDVLFCAYRTANPNGSCQRSAARWGRSSIWPLTSGSRTPRSIRPGTAR